MSGYWPVKPDKWPFAAVYIGSPAYNVLRVSWQLESDLRDAAPWRFSLEHNAIADESGGWQVIAGPAENIAAFDIQVPAKRGKAAIPFLRVKLNTQNNTYYSAHRSLGGLLTEQLWVYAQAISRRLVVERRGMPRVRGWLLKRRLSGTPCLCVDALSKTPTNSNCLDCYGTGLIGGYWKAIEGSLVVNTDPKIAANEEVGFTMPVSLGGLLLAVPGVMVGDVWVDKARNDRYVIKQIAPVELYGLQLASTVVMDLLHPTDVIYKLTL